MKELPFELKRMLDALGAKENVPMAQYTSFKRAAACAYWPSRTRRSILLSLCA